MLALVGHTQDGRQVYAGVFKFFETYGIPLDVLIGVMDGNGSIPCWISFHNEAVEAGMTHERILAKLGETLSDVYGAKFRDHVVEMLRTLHERGALI